MIYYKVDNNKLSDVKGYWKDSQGKLYIDNISLISNPSIKKLQEDLKTEQCLFLKGGKYAFIIDKGLSISRRFDKRVLLHYTIDDLKNSIDLLLDRYDGFTCFKEPAGYSVEIWL